MTYGTVQANSIQGSINTFSPNSAVFRNRIINGAMVISQRGTSQALTLGIGTYLTDRFQSYAVSSGASVTVSQSSTAPTGFANSTLWTINTGAALGSTDFNSISQKIEGYNVADLNWGTANAKTVTLSFWVRSSITGTYGVTFRNADASRGYGATYTISAANTWEQKSITIAGDTSGTWDTTNGIGILITWGLGVGSTYSGAAGSWGSGNWGVTGATNIVATTGATFYITGVQLEVGSTATSFDYRPYGTELALCQRYYQQVTGASGNGYYGIGTGTVYISTTADILAPLPVTMRAIPTTSFSGTIYLYDASGNPALTSISSTYGGQNNIYMQVVGSGGGLTTGRGVYLYTNNSTSSIFRFSAEL